jgi:hypothetical protein
MPEYEYASVGYLFNSDKNIFRCDTGLGYVIHRQTGSHLGQIDLRSCQIKTDKRSTPRVSLMESYRVKEHFYCHTIIMPGLFLYADK